VANKSGGLNLEILDKLIEKLDKAFLHMEKLSKSMEKLDTFEFDTRAFKSLKEMTDAATKANKALKKLDDKGMKKVDSFVNSISKVLDDLAKLNVKGATQAVNDIVKLVRSLEVLGGQSSVTDVNKTRDMLIKLLSPTLFKVLARPPPLKGIDGLIKLFTKLADLPSTSVVVIKSVAEVITELMRSFLPLADLPFGKAVKVFIKMKLLLAPLGSFLNGLKKLSKDMTVSQVKNIGGLLRALSQIVSGLTRFVKETSIAGVGIVKSIKLMIQLRILLKSLSPLFNRITKLSKDVSSSSLSAIASLFSGFGRVLEALSILVRDLKDINLKQSLVLFLKLRVVFGALSSALGAMVKRLSKVQPESLKGIAELLKGLGPLLASLSDVLGRVKGQGILDFNIKFILLLRNIFKAIGKLFENLVQTSKKTSAGDVASIAKLFEAMGRIFKSLSLLLQELPSQSLAKSAVKIFKGTGDLLKAIQKSLGKLKIKNISSVKETLEAMETMVRVLSRIGKDQGSKFFDDIEILARGVKKFVAEIGKIKVNRKARKNLESVAKMFNAFKGGKDGTAASGLGEMADGLSKLITAMDRIDKLPNLGVMNKVLKDWVKIINKTDSKKAEGFAKSIQAISKVLQVSDPAGVGGDPQKRQERAAKSTRRSMIEALVAVEALKLGIKGLNKVLRGTFKLLTGISTIRLFAKGLRGLKNASQQLREFGSNLREVGDRMRDMGTRVLNTVGVMKLFGGDAFKATVQFDKLGTQLEVFGGITKEQRKQAEAFAFEIGRKYPLSANNALEATLDLIKAGQDLSATEFILPSASDLAALSDSGDLNRAITTLIAAESTFAEFATGVEASFENIAVATNILSAGADISTASVESLGDGLANVGPAASAFGLSMEETVAVLAIFDQSAIKGAEGGTALRSMLNALSSEKTIKNLRALGISLFDEGGARKPLNDVINEIGASLDKMNPEQRAATLQGLADTFGRQGLQILLSQSADAIDNTVASMNEVAPASERAAAMLDNLAGDIVQLSGSFDTLKTIILIPLIERVVRPFIKFLRFLADGLLALDRRVLEFIGIAIGLASVIATIVAGVLILLGVFIQLGGVVVALVAPLLNVFNIFTFIAGGLVTLISLIGSLVLIFGVLLPVLVGVTAIFEGFFQIFSKDLGGASTAMRTFFSTLGGLLADIGKALGSIFSSIFFFMKTGERQESPLVRVGQVIASIFDNMTALLNSGALARLKKGLTDVAQIFSTVIDVFTFPRRMKEMDESIRDRADVFGESVEDINRIIGESQQKMRDDLRFTIQDVIKNNAILKKIFGDKTTFTEVSNFFTQLGALGAQFGKDIAALGRPLKVFVENVRRGKLSVGFDKLIDDLDAGFGRVLATVLTGFQTIFKIDFSDEIETALSATGGFGSAISDIFSRMVTNLRAQAIANREGLKKIFTKVVEFFLSPVKTVGFLGKVFGIQSLENFANEFNKILGKAFGSIFDFVFNLLEGQGFDEAATNAFGEAITPVLTFLDELGRTASLIFDIIGNIFAGITSLFVSGDDAANSVSSVFEGIFSALSDGLKLINDLILTPLSEGDILGAVGNIIPLVLNLLSTLGSAILGVLQSIDVPQVFSDIASAIFNLLFTAIEGGVTAIGGALGINVTPILDTIADAIQTNLDLLETGGTGAPFAIVASSIVSLFKAAVEGAFLAIGELFDIDVDAILADLNNKFGGLIDAIEELFVGENNIFNSVITIVDNFVKAIEKLFDSFSGEGAEDGEKGASAIQKLVEALGAFIGLGVDTFTAIVTGVTDLFVVMSEADPAAVALLGGAFFILAGGLTAVKTAAIGLGGAIKQFAGVLAVLVIVKSIAKNLTEVFEIFESLAELDLAGAIGDLVDAIGKIFTDITFDVLGVLGIEDIFGFTREDMKELIEGLANQITAIGGIFGNAVKSALEGLGRWLNRAILDIRIVIADAKKSLGLGADKFAKLGDIFRDPETIDIADFITATEEFDQTTIKQFAEGFREKLNRSFVEEFGQAEFLTDAMSQAITAMSTAGALDDLVKNAIDRGDLNMVKLIIEGQPETFEGDQLANIVKDIVKNIEDGVIAESDKADLLLPLLGQSFFLEDDAITNLINEQLAGVDLTGVTLPPEAEQDLRQALVGAMARGDEEMAAQIRGIFEALGVELTGAFKETIVEEVAQADIVKALVDLLNAGFSEEDVALNLSGAFEGLTPEEEAMVLEKALNIVNGVVEEVEVLSTETPLRVIPDEIVVITTDSTITTPDGEGEVVLDTPVVIDPSELEFAFDPSEFSDPETTEELNIQLENLVTNLILLQEEITVSLPLMVDMTTNLNVLTEALQRFDIAATDAFRDLLTALVVTGVAFKIFTFSLTSDMNTLNENLDFSPLLENLRDTESALKGVKEEAFTALSAVADLLGLVGILTGLGIVIGGMGEGRAEGGPTFAGKIYPVVERKLPEMLVEGGKSFLLPAQDGHVIPLEALGPAAAMAGVPVTPQMVAPTTNVNISITQGGISIGNVGAETDQGSLVREISAIMRGESDRTIENINSVDILRDRHR
jgi:TP901 family phage tail tape measure protein